MSHVALSSPQNYLIRPSIGPEASNIVTSELLQDPGEIIAEDTNNLMVQVATPTEYSAFKP